MSELVLTIGLVALTAGLIGTLSNLLLWRPCDPLTRLERQITSLAFVVLANACFWGARLLQ